MVAPDLIYELGSLLGALAALAAWVALPLTVNFVALLVVFKCRTFADVSKSNFDPLVIKHKESPTLLKCRILFPTIYATTPQACALRD